MLNRSLDQILCFSSAPLTFKLSSTLRFLLFRNLSKKLLYIEMKLKSLHVDYLCVPPTTLPLLPIAISLSLRYPLPTPFESLKIENKAEDFDKKQIYCPKF